MELSDRLRLLCYFIRDAYIERIFDIHDQFNKLQTHLAVGKAIRITNKIKMTHYGRFSKLTPAPPSLYSPIPTAACLRTMPVDERV